MSLIDTVIGGAQHAITWTGGSSHVIGLATAAVGGTVIGAAWKASNPHRGEPTAPLADAGSTITTGAIPALTYASGEQPRIPTALMHTPGAAIVTSSANQQSNIGPDGRTAYEAVGVVAIRTAVDQFYSAVCADPVLAPYFHGVEMDRLKRHQALFLGQLWGGPVHFDAERLESCHRHLNVSASAYWRVVGHLMTVLTSLRVPDWVCLFTLATLYDIRDRVVTVPQTCGSTGGAATGAQEQIVEFGYTSNVGVFGDLPDFPTAPGDVPGQS